MESKREIHDSLLQEIIYPNRTLDNMKNALESLDSIMEKLKD